MEIDTMALTARQVESAKPKEKPYKLGDAGGLYLYVAPTGLKSWWANYQQGGRQRTKTYGRYPEMSLAQARTAHAAAKDGGAETIASAPTFSEVAKQWLAVKIPALSNHKHKIQVQIQVQTTLERFA